MLSFGVPVAFRGVPTVFRLYDRLLLDLSYKQLLFNLLIVNYQLSIINYQLSIVNCQLSIVNCPICFTKKSFTSALIF